MKVVEELCLPWQDMLVIKQLGKSVVFFFFGYVGSIKGSWKLQKGFDLMDIDNSFCLIKFHMEDDRSEVIEGGPWMVFSHYIVQTWTP